MRCIPAAIAVHLSGVTGDVVELSARALPYLRRFAAGKTDFPQRWQQAVQDCGGEFDADSRALLARIGEILGAYDLSQQSRQLSWVQQQLEQGAQRILQESAHEKRMYAALGPLLGMALCILIG